MKNIKSGAAWVVVAAAVTSGCVGDRIVGPAEMRDGMLTGWYSHKTLYTYDKDTTYPTRCNCNGDCALKWPPFRPDQGDRPVRDYTIFKRDDGSPQWACKGKPIYFYVGDNKTGDMNGDGADGVWHAVKPAQ